MATASFTVSKQMMVLLSGLANPGDRHVPLGYWGALGSYARALMYAPVSFAGMTAINSAHLVFEIHDDDAPGDGFGAHVLSDAASVMIAVRRKTADWSESSAGTPTSVDETWGGSGASLVTSNWVDAGDAGSVGNAGSPDGTSWSVDITESVRDWFGGAPNYGLMIWNATSEQVSQGSTVEFYSRHSSGRQPYIVIDYETNTAPREPVSKWPYGGALVSSSVLQMKHDDPDAGDLATAGEFLLQTFEGTAVNDQQVGTSDGLWFYWGANPLVSGRHYRWKGRTYDGALWGPFSTNWADFWYEPAQPSPTISTPAANATVSTLTPVIVGSHRFLGSSTMSYAEIEVWGGGVLVWSSGQFAASGSSFNRVVPAGVLDWAKSYQVRARARTTLGTWSSWSAFQTFSTQGAGNPQNVQPSGVKLPDGTAVTVSFDAAAGDTITDWQYEVEGITTSGFTTSGIVGGAGGTSVSFPSNTIDNLTAAGGDYRIRVQYHDEVNALSPWSAWQDFHINASPSAPTLVRPAQGEVITTLTPTFVWDFNDPDEGSWGDTQTAYTLEVRDNATDALIATLSGTTAQSRLYDGPALVDETVYKWRVRTTDDDGVQGAFSSYQTFRPSQVPTVSAVSLNAGDLDAEGEIATPTPTVEWTYAGSGGKAQATYRVRAVRTLDESTVHDSGVIEGTATSYFIPNGLLTDAETYRFDVDVTDVDGLPGSGSSADYLADFAPPAELAGVTTIADPTSSKISVTWEPTANPDFDHYEVWRRVYGTTEWRVLSAQMFDIGTSSFDDYTAALNKTYEYAVMQVATIGTSLVQGAFSPVTTALSGVAQWYLVAENREDLTVALEWAESVSDTIPVQQQIIEALGRDYKIVVEGKVLGSEGEIAARIDGSQYADVARIESLLRAQLDRVLVKAPTGEVYPSKIGSIKRTRGEAGSVVLSLPYTQTEEA